MATVFSPIKFILWNFIFFFSPPECPPHCFPSHGVLLNLNTMDAFKSCDKKSELEKAAETVRTCMRVVENDTETTMDQSQFGDLATPSYANYSLCNG